MFKIYNNYTKKKEEFIPINKNEVFIYLCGPTVYDYVHVGNGRNLVLSSVIYNFLNFLGYKVKYISNITDIDDKIVDKAIEQKDTEFNISSKYLKQFLYDYNCLNLTKEVKRIKVTNIIENISQDIKYMLDKGYAYRIHNDIYFSTKRIKDYLCISSQKKEKLIYGHRIDNNILKKSPLDFVLWKEKKQGKIWKTDIGKGRPGWHTECFSIIKNQFKRPVDIHIGGIDLKFPHNENENAQALAFGWNYISKYWIWNGMIDFEGQKMSKSLNNYVYLKDILCEFSSTTIKYWYLSSHYRQPIIYDKEKIKNINLQVEKLKVSYKNSYFLFKLKKEKEIINQELFDNYEKEITSILGDDLNTPNLISYLHFISKKLNKKNKNSDFKDLYTYLKIFEHIDKLLNLNIVETVEKVTNKDVVLYKKWEEYKKIKNFQKSDKIRRYFSDKDIFIS